MATFNDAGTRPLESRGGSGTLSPGTPLTKEYLQGLTNALFTQHEDAPQLVKSTKQAVFADNIDTEPSLYYPFFRMAPHSNTVREVQLSLLKSKPDTADPIFEGSLTDKSVGAPFTLKLNLSTLAVDIKSDSPSICAHTTTILKSTPQDDIKSQLPNYKTFQKTDIKILNIRPADRKPNAAYLSEDDTGSGRLFLSIVFQNGIRQVALNQFQIAPDAPTKYTSSFKIAGSPYKMTLVIQGTPKITLLKDGEIEGKDYELQGRIQV